MDRTPMRFSNFIPAHASLYVSPPSLSLPPPFRKYFQQYGDCQVVWEQHTHAGNFARHAVVIRFVENPAANRVKQK